MEPFTQTLRSIHVVESMGVIIEQLITRPGECPDCDVPQRTCADCWQCAAHCRCCREAAERLLETRRVGYFDIDDCE